MFLRVLASMMLVFWDNCLLLVLPLGPFNYSTKPLMELLHLLEIQESVVDVEHFDLWESITPDYLEQLGVVWLSHV